MRNALGGAFLTAIGISCIAYGASQLDAFGAVRQASSFAYIGIGAFVLLLVLALTIRR